MTEIEQAWERLLDYRQRVRTWLGRDVPLADTRLRVARLLDSGFGYGWDDVEADFQTLGHRADFALALDGKRWGIVLVRAMGSGIGNGPPPEAFVLADGAGLRWTWVTDGAALTVFHVGTDFVARPIVSLDLAHDDESALRTAWDLVCRDGIVNGRLNQHRLSLLRPDPAAVRQALRDPAVLAALRQVLGRDFPNPGTDQELLGHLDDLMDGEADWDDTPDQALTQPSPVATMPDPPSPTPAAPLPEPETPPKRRRRGGWRLEDDEETATAALPEPTPLATPQPIDVPTISANEQAATVPMPPQTVPDPDANLPRRYRRTSELAEAKPPSDTLLTAMEKQKQTHERLRQNLRDLKENRARLQDALSELQRDYPERFERLMANKEAEPVDVGAKSASWTLLGHLQSMGNGYWEWAPSDNGSPGVRLN